MTTTARTKSVRKSIREPDSANDFEIRRFTVEEYHRLFDEYAITNAQFEALLKDSTKN